MVTLDEKMLKDIKILINDGFCLKALPAKDNILCYYRAFDKKIVNVKAEPYKSKITEAKRRECYEAFEVFQKGEDDHLRDEVGKLVAVTGATLSGREEQLYLLRKTFAPKSQNQDSQK
jgi:hypothetical protein